MLYDGRYQNMVHHRGVEVKECLLHSRDGAKLITCSENYQLPYGSLQVFFACLAM
jgi:hypothetical protein